MGIERTIIQSIHRSTPRDYLARMVKEKPSRVEIAKRFDREFFDGERAHGYGGYRYDGRWRPVARRLISEYGLAKGARVLDVGCGKGFLLRDFLELRSDLDARGFDISSYAIEHAEEAVQDAVFVHDARRRFPFEDDSLDLVVSVNTLHNLYLHELVPALREVERVGRRAYTVVESYRNETEKFNLVCWNLTGECFFTPDEWRWVFETAGYSGDYEFIFFE